MSESFDYNFELARSKSLGIYVDYDGDIGIQMDSGDDMVQAWVDPEQARKIATALLAAAMHADGIVKEVKP